MIILFLKWYWVDLPQRIYKIWLNYLWFFKNYFAITELLKSLVSPWRGVYFEKKSVGIEIGELFGNFVFNIFSRSIGAIIRLAFILIGIAVEFFVVIFGILGFAIWVIFPFVLIFCLVKGIQLI